MANVSVTHGVEINGDRVVKRFRSWARGEPQREWAALNLLAEYAPDLVPVPVHADLDGRPPTVVMSVLAGQSLGEEPVTPAQLDGIVDAIERLHGAVPVTLLETVEPLHFQPVVGLRQVRTMAVARSMPEDAQVRLALNAALSWLGSGGVERAAAEDVVPVFGHGDGNLANYLWDGQRVRFVDFEDSGRSDRAFELALFVEHLSVWADGGVHADAFLDRFGLTAAEAECVRVFRRLFAAFWLMMLLPGGPSHHRNPAGTLAKQALRLLDLLG